MVDAMLAMQSRQVEDARTLGSIEQLRDRVHALAVVHALLMASPDLRTFDAAEFLRELTAGLSASISSRERSIRSEEHTSELQSLMRISYAVFCLKNKKKT